MRRMSLRRPWTGALLLAVTSALVLVGAPQAGSSATAAPLAAEIDYVALGDSYSAGPLVPAQRADPFGCLRSSNNYPAYLAGYLGVRTYRDVTCSGARVKDFRLRQDTIVPGPPPPPQLAALSAETDLVTVGIGGNDFGLFGELIETCEAVRPQDPQGKPCKRHFTNKRGVDTKLKDAKRIRKHVVRGLREVRAAAPNAAVYIVGYPRLLPQRGTCAAVPFATGDYAWGRRIEKTLNRSVERAARKTGAKYVDLYPSTRGHDACGGAQAWINGSEIDFARAANFHPFKAGLHNAARVAYTRITGQPAPADGDADAMPPLAAVVPNLP